MPEMLVDTEFLSDKRVAKLARVMEWSLRETRGALLDVWAVCYQNGVTVLAADELDIAAEVDGFSDAFVAVDLGELRAHGIYVRGAHRILKNAESSNARARVRTRVRTRARTSLILVPELVGDQDQENVDLQGTQLSGSAIAPRERARKVSRAEYKPVTDAFQSRYEAAYGRKPKWGGREIKNVQSLLREHEVSEVIRRVHVMFDDPPRWMHPPFTLATLIAQFDTFVIGATEASRRHRQRDVSVGRYEPNTEPAADDRPPWELDQ